MSTDDAPTGPPSAAGTVWIWGPHAATALAAGVGVGLRATGGTAALSVIPLVAGLPAAALVLVLAVCVWRGRAVGNVDRGREVLYVALALAGVGVWLYAAGTSAWGLAAGLTGVSVAGGLAWWMWSRNATASFAATVGGVVGGVVALALRPTAHDVAPARWVAAWAAGTALAALPWWVNRSNRAAAMPTVLPDLEALAGCLERHARTTLTQVPGSVNVDATRWSVRWRTSDGRTVREVLGAVERVETEMGWRPGALTISAASHRRDEFLATVTPKAPALAAADRPPLPTSIIEPVCVGRHDDGRAMAISIYDKDNGARSMLKAGRPGTGKSQGLSTCMDGWTNTNDAVFLFADMSGGSTSAPWGPCTAWTEVVAEGCIAMLKAANAVATYRASLLPDLGWECWQPSPEFPAIIIVLDEAQSVLKPSYEARTYANRLVQVARKSGISLIVLTPTPNAMEGIEPPLRNQLAYRQCFGAKIDTATFVLAGTKAEATAYRVTEFENPGEVLGAGPGLDAVPGRYFPTPLADAKAAAVAHAAWRPVLDAGSARVLAENSDGFWQVPGERAMAGDPVPLTKAPASVAESTVGGASRWSDGDVSKAVLAVMERPGGPMPGVPWAEPMDLPPAPAPGRLAPMQVFDVMRRLMSREGGATPLEMVEATGRSAAGIQKTLVSWMEDGRVVKPFHGRYVWAGSVTQ